MDSWRVAIRNLVETTRDRLPDTGMDAVPTTSGDEGRRYGVAGDDSSYDAFASKAKDSILSTGDSVLLSKLDCRDVETKVGLMNQLGILVYLSQLFILLIIIIVIYAVIRY